MRCFQVKRVETVLKREPGKAWFVQIQPHTIDTDLEFLLDFNIVDICTQDEQSKFLKELVSRLGNSDAGKRSAGSKTPRAPEPPAAPRPRPATIPTSDGDGFHSLPMVLRAGVSSALRVNKLFFTLDSLQCTGNLPLGCYCWFPLMVYVFLTIGVAICFVFCSAYDPLFILPMHDYCACDLFLVIIMIMIMSLVFFCARRWLLPVYPYCNWQPV